MWHSTGPQLSEGIDRRGDLLKLIICCNWFCLVRWPPGLGAEPTEVAAQAAAGEDEEDEGQQNIITFGLKMFKARVKQFMAKKLESDALNQHLSAVSAANDMTPRSNLTGFDGIGGCDARSALAST
jgi:hypothetical protein